jgi:hypothetical protein
MDRPKPSCDLQEKALMTVPYKAHDGDDDNDCDDNDEHL